MTKYPIKLATSLDPFRKDWSLAPDFGRISHGFVAQQFVVLRLFFDFGFPISSIIDSCPNSFIKMIELDTPISYFIEQLLPLVSDFWSSAGTFQLTPFMG